MKRNQESFAIKALRIQRFLSQPFFVAEAFTNTPGRYVKLEDTISGFEAILKGDMDEYSERAFLFAGTIDEVMERGKTEAA